MIRSFRDPDAERLFRRERVRRVPPDLHRIALRKLLMLDAAKAWDLVFPDAESFNIWAEERYRLLVTALRSAIVELEADLPTAI